MSKLKDSVVTGNLAVSGNVTAENVTATNITSMQNNIDELNSNINQKNNIQFYTGTSAFSLTNCNVQKIGNLVLLSVSGEVVMDISNATNVPLVEFQSTSTNVIPTTKQCTGFVNIEGESRNLLGMYGYVDTNGYLYEHYTGQLYAGEIVSFVGFYAVG